MALKRSAPASDIASIAYANGVPRNSVLSSHRQLVKSLWAAAYGYPFIMSASLSSLVGLCGFLLPVKDSCGACPASSAQSNSTCIVHRSVSFYFFCIWVMLRWVILAGDAGAPLGFYTVWSRSALSVVYGTTSFLDHHQQSTECQQLHCDVRRAVQFTAEIFLYNTIS